MFIGKESALYLNLASGYACACATASLSRSLIHADMRGCIASFCFRSIVKGKYTCKGVATLICEKPFY